MIVTVTTAAGSLTVPVSAGVVSEVLVVARVPAGGVVSTIRLPLAVDELPADVSKNQTFFEKGIDGGFGKCLC